MHLIVQADSTEDTESHYIVSEDMEMTLSTSEEINGLSNGDR